MEKLLEFIDRLCLDEKLYWRIPLLAKSGTCEVAWRRDARPAAWSIRPVGVEEFTHFTKGELPKAIEQFGLDPFAFERQVGASILTQAVFADMVMTGAVELFGQEAVHKSIADTKSFLSGVSDAAKRVSSKTTGKALVKSAASSQKSPSRPTATLRLVAIAWALIAFTTFSTPEAQAEADAAHGHTESRFDVGDVAAASFAQVTLPSASAYLPFLGAGLAFHTDRATSYATQVLSTETFQFAVAIGLIANL